MTASRPRLLVIGLDGATFDILDPLIARGDLPALAAIIARGWRTEVLSTQPAATLPAWTSFLTGVPPGEHGLVDMFLPHRPSYAIRPVTGADRRLPTTLATLAARGLRVASLGVPGTFPPEALPNGLCVAGFDAPGVARVDRRGVAPPERFEDIEALGGWRYATVNELSRAPGRARRLVDALLRDIERKEHLALALYREAPWDLFVLHLQAADTAAHHLWHTFDRRSPRAHVAPPGSEDYLARIYRRLDALIGRLVDAAGPDTRILVVSDHGMGGASRTAVHLNRLLAELGLLRFVEAPRRRSRALAARSLERIAASLPPTAFGAALRHLPTGLVRRLLGATRGGAIHFGASAAFSYELDYAPSVWLNREGSFERGTVRAADVEPLLARISEALLALRDPETSAPVVRAVYRRDDYVAGPARELAPDLLIEPNVASGYRPSFLASRAPGPIVRRLNDDELAAPKGSGMPGSHRRPGVFLAAGPGVEARTLPALTLSQAGALVYPLVGEPPSHAARAHMPPFIDALLDVPEAVALAVEPLEMSAAVAEAHERDTHPVLARLRDLGYLD